MLKSLKKLLPNGVKYFAAYNSERTLSKYR